jgi:hypothetical protein
MFIVELREDGELDKFALAIECLDAESFSRLRSFFNATNSFVF